MDTFKYEFAENEKQLTRKKNCFCHPIDRNECFEKSFDGRIFGLLIYSSIRHSLFRPGTLNNQLIRDIPDFAQHQALFAIM